MVALAVGGEPSEGKGLVERAGSSDGAPHIDVGRTGGNDCLAEPKSGCFIETLTKVADLAHFADMNAVYAKYFQAPFPARSTIQVVALPRGAQVEIEVVAVA